MALTGQTWRQWGRLLLLSIALALTVMGARLVMIEKMGSDLPYWDQWGAELEGLIQPYWEGKLDLAAMIRPHNEHRILLTRALVLGLFLENGQWDGRLEAVVNVFFQVLVAVGIFLLGSRFFSGAGICLWWAVLACAYSLPFGYENTLVGFQSQFYLMSGFSMLVFWLGSTRSIHPLWRAGGLLLPGACLLFTMGSGFLAPAMLLFVLLAGLVRHENSWSRWRAEIPSLLTLAMVVVTGFLLLPHVPQHDNLKAAGVADFLNAAARSFSWPWSYSSSLPMNYLAAFGMWLPWCIYSCCVLVRKQRLTRQDIFLLALGGWAALQMAAMSWSRGVNGMPPASRYADTLVFGLLANFLALWALPEKLSFTAAWHKKTALLAIAWMALAAAGLTCLTLQNVLVDLPERQRLFAAQRDNVARFIADGNEAHLLGKPDSQLPYWDTKQLITWLRDPAIRNILPMSVREPLSIREDLSQENDGFSPDGLPEGFASTSAPWVRGSFLAAQGGQQSKGNYHGTFEHPGNFPYLCWTVAGHLEEGGSTLSIKSDKTRRQKLLAPPAARGSWKRVFAKARPGTYEIRASDKSITRWLAFTEPREIGRLSVYAHRLLDRGILLLIAGAGLFLFLVTWAIWCSVGKSSLDDALKVKLA